MRALFACDALQHGGAIARGLARLRISAQVGRVRLDRLRQQRRFPCRCALDRIDKSLISSKSGYPDTRCPPGSCEAHASSSS
jgi:hypothetical protein